MHICCQRQPSSCLQLQLLLRGQALQRELGCRHWASGKLHSLLKLLELERKCKQTVEEVVQTIEAQLERCLEALQLVLLCLNPLAWVQPGWQQHSLASAQQLLALHSLHL